MQIFFDMILYSTQDLYGIVQEFGIKKILEILKNLELELCNQNVDNYKQVLENVNVIKNFIYDKISNTGKLFSLNSSVSNSIYIECFDYDYDFRSYLFTDFDLAEKHVEKLKSDGYSVNIVEVVNGKKRRGFFDNCVLAGVKIFILNPSQNEYQMPINIFTDIPIYDGFRNPQSPLFNMRLNAILSEYSQSIVADKSTTKLENNLFDLLYNSYFVAPIVVDGEVDKIDHTEVIYRFNLYQVNNNGVNEIVMPVFTDRRLMTEWLMSNNNENLVGNVIPFAKFYELIKYSNVKFFIINPSTHNLSLSSELILNAKMKH